MDGLEPYRRPGPCQLPSHPPADSVPCTHMMHHARGFVGGSTHSMAHVLPLPQAMIFDCSPLWVAHGVYRHFDFLPLDGLPLPKLDGARCGWALEGATRWMSTRAVFLLLPCPDGYRAICRALQVPCCFEVGRSSVLGTNGIMHNTVSATLQFFLQPGTPGVPLCAAMLCSPPSFFSLQDQSQTTCEQSQPIPTASATTAICGTTVELDSLNLDPESILEHHTVSGPHQLILVWTERRKGNVLATGCASCLWRPCGSVLTCPLPYIDPAPLRELPPQPGGNLYGKTRFITETTAHTYAFAPSRSGFRD